MTTTIEERGKGPVRFGPLALHVQALRQWAGPSGVSQEELSKLAGVSARVIRKYESMTRLPETLECLLLIALALRVPVERLIDPRTRERLANEVESRRESRDPRKDS